jgi:DNA-binding winged helix-turn-helix (wHTH) protein
VAAKLLQPSDLEIDTEMHKVTVTGRTVTLTPIEYALLEELAQNVGRVLTTHLLLQRVWGTQYSDATDYVKGVIRGVNSIQICGTNPDTAFVPPFSIQLSQRSFHIPRSEWIR